MPTEATEQTIFTVGDRLIHAAHGDGRVVSVDDARGRITVEFRNETSTQLSKRWRELIGRGHKFAVESDQTRHVDPLKVTIGITYVTDKASRIWTIPQPIDDYPAHLALVLDYLENAELTVKRDNLRTVWTGLNNFNRLLGYFKFLNRADRDLLLEGITEGVDLCMGRHLLNACTKRGGAREADFEKMETRCGDNLWADTVYFSISSPALRAELDRALVALVYMSTPPALHEDDDALKATAELILAAIERRIQTGFSEEITLRRSQEPIKSKAVNAEQESEALVASAE